MNIQKRHTLLDARTGLWFMLINSKLN